MPSSMQQTAIVSATQGASCSAALMACRLVKDNSTCENKKESLEAERSGLEQVCLAICMNSFTDAGLILMSL